MTDLQIRKMRFGFADHPVPFLWNPENPAFSSMANAVSFLAIAFEKMIGAMITEAMPLITDPAVREEADAFVRQEGQHSMAHRQHAKGLIKSYPGLKDTLDDVIGAFDHMTATTPLKYRLAYTADLEATFTPADIRENTGFAYEEPDVIAETPRPDSIGHARGAGPAATARTRRRGGRRGRKSP